MAVKSTDKTKSRYVQGGTTDVFANRLGWWERKIFEKSQTDIQYIIRQSDAGRPDLIAYNVYRDVRFMWLVLQYNTIVDPNEELTLGTVITLPSPERAQLEFTNTPTGGNIVVDK